MNSYILVDDIVTPCPNPMKYAKFVSDPNNTRIRKNTLGKFSVSTIFIGLAGFIFETALLLNDDVIHTFHTETKYEAIKKHVSLLQELEKEAV